MILSLNAGHSKIYLLTPNTRFDEAKFRGFDLLEIVTKHCIELQLAPVCSEFFEKLNDTNGNFLASVVFLKKAKNCGLYIKNCFCVLYISF